jgi:hypothetical protein
VLIQEEDDRKFFNARESFLSRVVQELLWHRLREWVDISPFVDDDESKDHMIILTEQVNLNVETKLINLKNIPVMTRLYTVDRLCYEAFHSSKRNEFKKEATRTTDVELSRPLPFGMDTLERYYYDFRFGDCRICTFWNFSSSLNLVFSQID